MIAYIAAALVSAAALGAGVYYWATLALTSAGSTIAGG